MRLIKNNLKYIVISLLIVLPSLFDCEQFLFIRWFSLLGIITLFIIYMIDHNRNINLFAFILLILYTLSFVIHYNIAVNAYNARMHFIEYGVYFLIMVFVSSIKWDSNKLFRVLSNAVIISGIIQIIYSYKDIISFTGRIEGNTVYPNFLSLLLILSIIASGFLFIKHFILQKSKWGLLYLLLTIIFVFADLRTGSRNTIILLPIVFFSIIFSFKKRWAFIALFVSLAMLFIFPSNAKNRLFHERKINPYGVQRANIYIQAAGIAMDNMPFGIGYNNLEYYSLKNNFPVEGRIGRYGSYAKIAHNEYLEWFVNAGILGLLILLITAYSIFAYIKNKKRFTVIDKFALSSLFIILVMSIFDSALYLPYNAVIFFIISGILLKKLSIKKPILKTTLLVIGSILIILSITDIYTTIHTRSLKLEKQIKNNISVQKLMDVNNLLKRYYLLTSKQNYLEADIVVSEQIYSKTGDVKYFQNILDDYGILFDEFPMEFKYHLSYIDLLKRYCNTLLSRNNDINGLIIRNYKIAIELNPYNPFIRYDFANQLLHLGDTFLAVKQLEQSIKYEPYFLRGLQMLSHVIDDAQLKERNNEIMDSLPALIESAKTPYEYQLLQKGL